MRVEESLVVPNSPQNGLVEEPRLSPKASPKSKTPSRLAKLRQVCTSVCRSLVRSSDLLPHGGRESLICFSAGERNLSSVTLWGKDSHCLPKERGGTFWQIKSCKTCKQEMCFRLWTYSTVYIPCSTHLLPGLLGILMHCGMWHLFTNFHGCFNIETNVIGIPQMSWISTLLKLHLSSYAMNWYCGC